MVKPTFIYYKKILHCLFTKIQNLETAPYLLLPKPPLIKVPISFSYGIL